MTQLYPYVIYEKNTHPMTLVDPCGLLKEHTCNELQWIHVVYENNTNAMTLVDPWGL